MSIYTHAFSIIDFPNHFLLYYFIEIYLQIDLKFAVALVAAFLPSVNWYYAAVAVEQFLQQLAFHALLFAYACN